MNKSHAIKLQGLLDNGELKLLAKELEPHLAQGDLDARYLACRFSVDPNETGEAFDLRKIRELSALASKWHRASLIDLAWAYRHGDDIERDEQKFQNLMTAAALLGDQGAIRVVAEFLKFEIGETGLNQVLDQQND